MGERVSVACREGGEDLDPNSVTIKLAYRRGQLAPYPECGKLCRRPFQ